jgi:IS30 family transposase
LKACRKRKFFYGAQNAMAEYKSVLVESRQGIDSSANEILSYNELIRQGLRKGQGIHHIMNAHPDVFQKCEKTLYNYFNKNVFSLPRGDMPRLCMRKPKVRPKIRHQIDSRCRNGRTFEDFHLFLTAHPDISVVQMDSVIGHAGGKVLLTLQFECGLLLACLRDTNNSQSVMDYFDMLERKFTLDAFKRIFPVILTDNGSEFSNPSALERSIFTGARRTRIFYCDPNAAWQKGCIENNHTNLRRSLPKKSSFDKLSQIDIDLVLSHLNSYIRKHYDDVPPLSRFNEIYGDEILAQLNINLVPPDEVIWDEKLLKGKI